jgi:hypothetical protein
MPLQESDYNVQAIVIEPTVLVDEVSTDDFYIGTSRSYRDPASANWRIKRIWKVGNVWKQGFANGDQGFTFIWDLRFGYVYS